MTRGTDKYTKLMLHMDDYTFKDECGHIVTNNGVILDNTNKKFGDNSAYLGGDNKSLFVVSSEDFNFYNQDFTIDFFYKGNLILDSTLAEVMLSNWSAYPWRSGCFSICQNHAKALNKISIWIADVSSTQPALISNDGFDDNWHHLAFIRNNNALYLYIDGIKKSSIKYTQNLNLSFDGFNIGKDVVTNGFKGNIDELRVSKGIARWTDNFIPPVLPYSKYDYKFLIKQDNNYHTIKSNLHSLGQPTDNVQLKTWFDKHGVDDINILTETLSKKETPMTKEELTSIWKTDFELDANDITGNIELIDTDENNKSIKYDCNNYRILDLLQDKFDIMMLK